MKKIVSAQELDELARHATSLAEAQAFALEADRLRRTAEATGWWAGVWQPLLRN